MFDLRWVKNEGWDVFIGTLRIFIKTFASWFKQTELCISYIKKVNDTCDELLSTRRGESEKYKRRETARTDRRQARSGLVGSEGGLCDRVMFISWIISPNLSLVQPKPNNHCTQLNCIKYKHLIYLKYLVSCQTHVTVTNQVNGQGDIKRKCPGLSQTTTTAVVTGQGYYAM